MNTWSVRCHCGHVHESEARRYCNRSMVTAGGSASARKSASMSRREPEADCGWRASQITDVDCVAVHTVISVRSYSTGPVG